MGKTALYINGNHEDILQGIVNVQAAHPEQILYIQPHRNDRMAYLRDNPPTMDDPVTMYSSITTDLNRVHFTGEVVGWDDKETISPQKREKIDKDIKTWQAPQPGVFEGGVNLLHIRRLVRVEPPFDAAKLIKTSDNKPLKPRSVAGGWSYVKPLMDGARGAD